MQRLPSGRARRGARRDPSRARAGLRRRHALHRERGDRLGGRVLRGAAL